MIHQFNNDKYTVMVDDTIQVQALFPLSKGRQSITKPLLSELYQNNIEGIAPWGDGNDFPQLVYKDMSKNAELSKGIDMQARMLMAGGLRWKIVDPIDNTLIPNNKIERNVIKEILSLQKNSWGYTYAAARNFYTFINVFPQLDTNLGRDKIARIFPREASHCRLSIQNTVGDIEKVYVNSNWPDARYDDEETITLPYVDSLFESADHIKQREISSFVFVLSIPTGKTYYQLADWNPIRAEWLPLLNAIPTYKKAVMENQITVKYHIHFPDYYWVMKFGDEYETWDNVKKLKKQKEEFKAINEVLKGAANAGRSIATTFKTHPDSGKDFPGVKIEEIGDRFKDGIYLEDASDATIKLYSSLGFDSSLFGIAPGGGKNNRSGSDKREAFMIHRATLQPHEEILLKPFDLASDFNGWNSEYHQVKWYFPETALVTLDKVSPSKRNDLIKEPDAA
jgi:hypothetical protein